MSQSYPSDLEALLKLLLVRVPGATIELLQLQLSDTMRDLTSRALVWPGSTTVQLAPDATDYLLSTPGEHTQIDMLTSVNTADGRMLAVPMAPYGGNEAAMREVGLVRGPPRVAILPAPNLMRVFPAPDEAYDLHLQYAVTALDYRAPVPPGFFSQFHDALLAGVLSRVYAIPSTPYSSPRLAEFFGRRARSEMVSARITALRSSTRALRPVVPFPRPAGAINA